MTARKIVLIIIAAVLVYFALLLHAQDRCLTDRYWGLQLTQDKEVNDYYDRGYWPLDKTVPYATRFEEYPQLAVYLFTLPHIVKPTLCHYRIIFNAMMFAVFLIVVWIVVKLATLLESGYANMLVLALPAMLWYTANRYDIFPAALSLGSLYLLLRNKNTPAFFFLGLAIMAKWYPLMYIPLFLSYIYKNQGPLRKDRYALYKPLAVLFLTVGAFCLHTIFWAGLEGFFMPYQFHWLRASNGESLFYFLEPLFNTPGKLSSAKIVFFMLQFICIPAVLAIGVKTKKELVISMGIVTLAFILFAKYHSPQWLLWATPLLLLNRGRFIFVALVLYDLCSYLYYPIGSDLAYKLIRTPLWADHAYKAIIFCNIPIKVVIIVWLFKKLLARPARTP